MWRPSVPLPCRYGSYVQNAFMSDVQEQRQSIPYCGVNTYHQNREAEKWIRDLQVQAWTIQIHAIY